MLITKIYKPSEFNEAAKELRLGELVAFPTETVYGGFIWLKEDHQIIL